MESLGAELLVIVQAEEEADRILRAARSRKEQSLADLLRERELRLKNVEDPRERKPDLHPTPPNLKLLRALAARNQERAVTRILEAFDAAP